MERKNLLVSYEGGGYDGCFWEWNYFLFNAVGEFHVVYASGYKGIKTEKEAIELLEGDESEYTSYDLTQDSEIESFQNNEPIDNVLHIVEKASESEYGELAIIWFRCDHCGNKIYGDHGIAEGRHGCGGIATTAEEKYCYNCHSLGTCEKCGEFDNDLLESGDEYCEYCKEKNVEENFKDLEGTYLEFNNITNEFEELDIEVDVFEFTDMIESNEKIIFFSAIYK